MPQQRGARKDAAASCYGLALPSLGHLRTLSGLSLQRATRTDVTSDRKLILGSLFVARDLLIISLFLADAVCYDNNTMGLVLSYVRRLQRYIVYIIEAG